MSAESEWVHWCVDVRELRVLGVLGFGVRGVGG